MTVVRLMVQYHEFGWAMKKLMGADNVRVSSQREFAEKMTSEGYPVGQQLISDYMRLKTEDVDGEELEIPRAYAPIEFLAAVITIFKLTASQREDLVSSWLEILPDKRRTAVLSLVDTLRGADIPSEAWREMLALEQEEGLGGQNRGTGGGSAQDRAS